MLVLVTSPLPELPAVCTNQPKYTAFVLAKQLFEDGGEVLAPGWRRRGRQGWRKPHHHYHIFTILMDPLLYTC